MHNIAPAHMESILRSDSLLAEFSDNEVREVARCARHVHFESGEAAFTRNMKGRHVFFIVEGRFRVTRTNPNGKELLFAMIEAGTHFGESALTDGGARGVDIIADQSSCALTVGRAHLLPIFEGNARAAMSLARLVSGHLRSSMEHSMTLALGDTAKRVWGRLMHLANQYGRNRSGDGALRIEHGLSQQSLADSVGLTRVMVNRQLRSWSDRGLLEIGRGFVVIPDREALSDHVWGRSGLGTDES